MRQAIERLYTTFAPYPLPDYTDPCRCCHTTAEEDKLHAKPVRELAASDLNQYAFDALLVWGDEKVFKHLLPRLYELYFTKSRDPLFEIDPEILFRKFHLANWQLWPSSEQASVSAFLHAVWTLALSSNPFELSEELDAWLSAIAQCEEDLSPYLQSWRENQSLQASLALSEAIITNEIGSSAFWDDFPQRRAQVLKWLRSDAVTNKLQAAQLQWPDYRHEFASALEITQSDEP